MSLPPFHVLIIDDNPADLRLTIQAIAEAGMPCGVSIAGDGESALEGLRSIDRLPDLILLDLNMPGKDGFTVIRELKSASRTRLIPVVILSSSSARNDIELAYRESASCYIVKPLGFDEYAKVILALSSFWFRIARLPGQLSDHGRPTDSGVFATKPTFTH